MDEEIYEKVITDDSTLPKKQIVYQVNNNNELIYFHMDEGIAEVAIPGAIGPYRITSIGSNSFQRNHYLTKITIPSSITTIENDAFKGCHNLTDVMFETPISLSYIGEGAFDTQVVDPILDECELASKPELTFTADAVEGCLPFEYAMNPSSNINTGSQEQTYITFYTGWPSNLTVQYNPETGKSELVDYPKMSDLSNYTEEDYPYITPAYAQAAASASLAYTNGDTLTEDQKDILNAALNPVIPSGVESIKEGIFSNLNTEGEAIDPAGAANQDILSVTMSGVETIDPYTFAGCENLVGAYINDGCTKLGDYAFKGCKSLNDVDILSDLQEFGRVPFLSCDALSHVEFGSKPNYTCENAVVYSTANGEKVSLLEVLKARGVSLGSGTLTADELAGISSIAPEAVADCDGIVTADCTPSNLTELTESSFENTDQLYSVILPESIRKIGKYAFRESNIRYLEIPKSLSVIDSEAFEGDNHTITFYCEPDSPAADYASNFTNIVVSDKPITYTVSFYDDDGVTLLDTIEVAAGADAQTHITPTKPGYVFKTWMPLPVNIMENTKTYATYVPEDEITYTVTFVDHDDKVLDQQIVPEGGDAREPFPPTRENYTFTGWRPAFTNVTDDLTIYAQYERIIPPADDKEEPSE